MYSSVGVGAHMRPPSLFSTNFSACRFRASTHIRRELQSEYRRTWDSFGLICKRSGSVVVRAQVHGEVAAVTVREVESGCDDGVNVAIGYGWKVREAARFDVEELRAVAHVQASSFHIEAAVFDDLFFKLFQAEVLSTLLYKAKHSPPDRYACLLAEPATTLMDDDESAPPVVGAVNLAASVENEVLRHLQDADEYLYVSGMAVDTNHRRQNVATLLLGACDLLATKWGFSYLALHAYEDDMAARTLYARGGYRVVALDPLWMSTWVGRKRRVLMAKQTNRADS